MEEKNFYLTKNGLGKIEKEYKFLKELMLAKTRGEEAPKIWESEDLNPEYLSFREDMDLIETRIAELENILKNVKLISLPSEEKESAIGIGATVLVETGKDKSELTIVGTLEADPVLGRVSNESPVGRALLGHKVGDEVVISSSPRIFYKIKKIQYKEI